MTDCQSTLLKLLSKALFMRNVELTSVDWTELLREAQNQAVIQLVYEALDKGVLPNDVDKRWKNCALASLANNVQVNHNHALLHRWMTAADVPYVVLKGCSSAFYYPDPVARAMGDVDFLVSRDDLEKAGKVLEEQGLKPWDSEHIAHIVYRAPGMHYEMHFNVAGIPHGEAGDLVHEYLKDVYEKASVQSIGVGDVVLPSPFHHGLIILLHTCHHLTGEGIGLRHLCDWAVFENRFSDSEFRELFEEKLRAIGLWKFARVLTRISIKYLGADGKKWALCDERLAESIMDDILAGGNFGSKENSRNMQTLLISDRGKNGVGRVGMLAQLIESFNNVIYLKWPRAKRIKLLVPVGWLYFGTRRFIRELMGKRRKTNIKRTIVGARVRRNLYQQLALYEKETQ